MTQKALLLLLLLFPIINFLILTSSVPVDVYKSPSIDSMIVINKSPMDINKTNKKHIQTTLVTALYDINRQNNDGRKFDTYISWLLITCELHHPMVIYLDKNVAGLIEQVKEKRAKSHYSTIIVSTTLFDVPYAWMKENVTNILLSARWKLLAKYPAGIENQNSNYVIIQYSKFQWMLQAMGLSRRYWHSNVFGWVDAGINRFFPSSLQQQQQQGSFVINKDYIYKAFKNNLFITAGSHKLPFLLNGTLRIQPDSFIGTNENIVKGTIFITSTNRLIDVSKSIDHFIKNELLVKSRIDNEQIAMALIIQEHLDWFGMFRASEKGNHIDEFIFTKK